MTLAVRLQSDGARRAGSAALAALLHLLLLALLLQTMTRAPRPVAVPRETILRLLPLLAQPKAEKAAPAAVASPRLPSRVRPLVPPPPAEATPSIQGLGQSLFGCAPENLANLTPDQRAHCTGGRLAAPDDSQLAQPKSHVKDPARRAAEMATKNTPGVIPCAVIMQAPAPYGGTAVVPGFNPFCVLKGLSSGFGPLNGLAK